jgi:hypothetical protein
MELEKLKENWQELSEKIEKRELFNKEVTMNMLKKNAKSSIDKLERYEFIFLLISFFYAIFLGLALFVNEERLIVNESIWACIELFAVAGGWQAFKLILLQKNEIRLLLYYRDAGEGYSLQNPYKGKTILGNVTSDSVFWSGLLLSKGYIHP